MGPVGGYRLLIFDWDGTLMDSIAAIVGCMQQAAADLGRDRLSEETIRGAVGLGLAEMLARMGIELSAEESERLIERYRHHWFATFRERPRLFARARETVETLRSRGHLLAIATGKGRRGLDRDLAATGLDVLFDASRTADEARSKPDPMMLHALLDELGVAAGEALMIGDAAFDLEMASRAGMDAVGVLSGTHGREALMSCSPLDCLRDVTALPDWLLQRAERAPSPAGLRAL